MLTHKQGHNMFEAVVAETTCSNQKKFPFMQKPLASIFSKSKNVS